MREGAKLAPQLLCNAPQAQPQYCKGRLNQATFEAECRSFVHIAEWTGGEPKASAVIVGQCSRCCAQGHPRVAKGRRNLVVVGQPCRVLANLKAVDRAVVAPLSDLRVLPRRCFPRELEGKLAATITLCPDQVLHQEPHV